ncbi:MAG TPA: HypC/HybG/HupF family hydrogenase formation chaperone [bacterium]|nr:HypC/HybG/HupF family hydrogenase formation chaperone [bacterium]
MCLAIPGKVTEITDAAARLARVEVSGTPRIVNTVLLDDVAPGDWVLVQVGFAVAKLDEAEARQTLDLLEEMSAAYEADLAAAVEEDR